MEHDHMPSPPALPSPRPSLGESAGTMKVVVQQQAQLCLAALAVADEHGSPDCQPPGDLSPPALPTTLPLRLPPIQPPHEKLAGSSGPTLPPLSSVAGAQAHAPLPKHPAPLHPVPSTPSTNHWPSLNPFTTYYTPSHLDPVESSPSTGMGQIPARPGASVSLDDPDVRMAAEALGQMKTGTAAPRDSLQVSRLVVSDADLRLSATDFGSSPRTRTTSPASSADNDGKTLLRNDNPATGSRAEPEPLLTLITTSHPLLATTIEGATTAYNSGKNYSPRIRTGAEYVESYLKPVGKAVGSVGRKTGVEGGVRWIFGMRNRKQHASTDIETVERGSSKRRRSERHAKEQTALGSPQLDPGADADARRLSVSTVDTLPAYDDQRSPAYTELADSPIVLSAGPGSSEQPWGQRLVVTTSGLGVAMKQESMKSLRYCLQVLRDTHGYIDGVLVKLKIVIDEFDAAAGADGQGRPARADGPKADPDMAATRSTLIAHMNELRDDVIRVIQRTVQTISQYAGGALPENAKNIVHRQLMSIPGLYQFHYVRESGSRSENASPEIRARDKSYLALLFARETLQLMAQIADVLNRTLVSAEDWCETLYKRKEQTELPVTHTESLSVSPAATADQDTCMSG